MKMITHIQRIFFAELIALSILSGSDFIRIESGARWLKWLPDQPSRAEITTLGYAGLSVSAELNYRNIIRLHNLNYEFSNGIAAPTTKSRDELIREKTGTAGYILFNLLGDLMLPKTKYNLGLMLQADYQDYRSTVSFTDNVTYIPYNYMDSRSITYFSSGDEAEFYTRFHEFFAGISAGSAANDKNYGRFYLGIGSTMYQKPYTFHIGDMEIEDTMTDTRFNGIFLGMGLFGTFPLKHQDQLQIELFYHQGAGDMVLVRDRISITDIADNNNSSIYYSAMDSRVCWSKPIVPEKLTFSAEGSFAVKSFDLNTPGTTVQDAPNMNQDYFFGLKATLVYRIE